MVGAVAPAAISLVLHSRTIVACVLSTLLGAASAPQSRSGAPVSAPAGIVWLILLDDLHMDFRNPDTIESCCDPSRPGCSVRTTWS